MKLNGLTAQAVNIVANIAPWIAPLPTAWLVYARTMKHLHWPDWVAISAGVTLELLGVAILATALDLYRYNETRRKSDPKAPLWIGLTLTGLYFVTALMLTFVLDVWPVAALIAPALFPVLSVAAFALLALRTDHEQRLDAIAMQKADAKAEYQRKKDARAAQKDAPPMQKVDPWNVQTEGMTKMERVRLLALQMPEWSRAELAQEAGCSASTVTRALGNAHRKGE